MPWQILVVKLLSLGEDHQGEAITQPYINPMHHIIIINYRIDLAP